MLQLTGSSVQCCFGHNGKEGPYISASRYCCQALLDSARRINLPTNKNSPLFAIRKTGRQASWRIGLRRSQTRAIRPSPFTYRASLCCHCSARYIRAIELAHWSYVFYDYCNAATQPTAAAFFPFFCCMNNKYRQNVRSGTQLGSIVRPSWSDSRTTIGVLQSYDSHGSAVVPSRRTFVVRQSSEYNIRYLRSSIPPYRVAHIAKVSTRCQ